LVFSRYGANGKLFGSEKGAFSRAASRKKGCLEVADGGEAHSNVDEAARLLGIHPNYLHRLIRDFDLTPWSESMAAAKVEEEVSAAYEEAERALEMMRCEGERRGGGARDQGNDVKSVSKSRRGRFQK
jgi:hypothetical protein